MSVHRDDILAFVNDFVDDDCADNSSGVDVLVDFCSRLREFLDEHDATDWEFRVMVVRFVGPFLRATHLSSQVKEDIRRKCPDALGADILRTH